MTAEKKLDGEAATSADSTENEIIIELTEEISGAFEDDDEIIELNDVIVKTNATPAVLETSADNKQEIEVPDIPATDAAADPADKQEEDLSSFADSEIRIADKIDDEPDFSEGDPDDFVNSLGMDLETNTAINQLSEENEDLAETAPFDVDMVSSEQFEAVIERVIMKILPEKIDGILSAAIEKTLTNEINKIKEILLEDSAGGKM